MIGQIYPQDQAMTCYGNGNGLVDDYHSFFLMLDHVTPGSMYGNINTQLLTSSVNHHIYFHVKILPKQFTECKALGNCQRLKCVISGQLADPHLMCGETQ